MTDIGEAAETEQNTQQSQKQNNTGDNDEFRFSWDHGLGEAPNTNENQQTQEVQSQQQNQPVDSNERINNYLKQIPVKSLQLNEEQFENFKNGSLDDINAQLAGMQRHAHMHTLQTVNNLMSSKMGQLKQEILREANVNNLSTDVLDYVKTQHAAAADPILGPVIESAVSKIMSNGTVDKVEISNAIGKILKHMGEKTGGGSNQRAGQHNPSVDGEGEHTPDDWFSFVKDLS